MNRMYKKGPTISSSCSAGSNGTRVPGTGYKKKVIIYNLYLEQIRDFLKMDRKALANRQPESRNVYIFMGAQNAVRPFLPSWLEHCLALRVSGPSLEGAIFCQRKCTQNVQKVVLYLDPWDRILIDKN